MHRCVNAVLLTQHGHEINVRDQSGDSIHIGSVFGKANRSIVADNAVILYGAVHNEGFSRSRLFKAVFRGLNRAVVQLLQKFICKGLIHGRSVCTAGIHSHCSGTVMEGLLNLFQLCDNGLRVLLDQALRLLQKCVIGEIVEIVIVCVKRGCCTVGTVKLCRIGTVGDAALQRGFVL